MNYKMTFTLLAFSLLFCATPTSAQVEVKWEQEMPGNILWQQVTHQVYYHKGRATLMSYLVE